MMAKGERDPIPSIAIGMDTPAIRFSVLLFNDSLRTAAPHRATPTESQSLRSEFP